MAVACGDDFTAAVMEEGGVAQLVLGRCEDQLLSETECVRGADEVFDGKAIMVAAGRAHIACVAADGACVWTWGAGGWGQLGHGDEESRKRPLQLGKELFGESPAVMVACGHNHTLVLTACGRVFSCGCGGCGQLGHGDTSDQLLLMLVAAERLEESQIVMVAAGEMHSVALGADGGVWTWGAGYNGRLGHNDAHERLVPTALGGDEALDGATVVFVSTRGAHTLAVTKHGVLWAWGWGLFGQLGLGDVANRLAPARVGGQEVFGSPVLVAACGYYHTLAVTEDGSLYSFGRGKDSALGHSNNSKNRLVPTCVPPHLFGNAKIVSAAGGFNHSAALDQNGALFTWGGGHSDAHRQRLPTRVALQGALVGRCRILPPLNALAFAMGTHSRLGGAVDSTGPASPHTTGCVYLKMPGELVQKLVWACGLWPEGKMGNLDGVVRLLGGGNVLAQE